MRTCGKCALRLPTDYFSTKSTWCKYCHADYVRQHYLKNKQTYVDRAALRQKALSTETKNKYNALRSTWKKNNKGRVNAATARRHAAKVSATPAWLTADDHWWMEEVYDLASLRTAYTGIAWHVDHIIPLQGNTVCGLHVPSNLQVIPAAFNCSKSNKF
jgi:hypothetical protein